MSAVNASIPSASLDAERRAHEPSMEEILASIRRIIADDEALPVAARRDKERIEPRLPAEAPHEAETAPPRQSEPAAAEVEAQNRAPVVVPVRLPQAAAPRPSLPSPVSALEPQDFWLRAEPPSEPADCADTEEREDAASAPQDAGKSEELQDDFAAETEAESGEFLADADETGEEEEEPVQPLVSPGAAASVASHFQALAASMVINEADVIERYAQDILRPMLKQWLDDNLPLLVEKLVRAEIERVARGRR